MAEPVLSPVCLSSCLSLRVHMFVLPRALAASVCLSPSLYSWGPRHKRPCQSPFTPVANPHFPWLSLCCLLCVFILYLRAHILILPWVPYIVAPVCLSLSLYSRVPVANPFSITDGWACAVSCMSELTFSYCSESPSCPSMPICHYTLEYL